MKNYKTIAIFTFQSEYAILKHLLEHHNIRYIFLNETTAGVLPIHLNSFGGIRLQVHEDDIPYAHEILSRLENYPNLKIVK